MAPRPQMRNWIFTKYDLSFPELDLDTKVRYCIYQHEVCPTTGREHLQGYLELKKSMRRNAVKRMLSDESCHLEARQGTRDQAKAYCCKEDTRKEGTLPIELGTWETNQGRRSDLEDVYAKVLEGKTPEEIAELCPIEYMKYSKAIKEMAELRQNRVERQEALDRVQDAELRPWQEECITDIQNQDDRQVLWITDMNGGKGKSWLTTYLNLKYGALIVTGGNSNDIAYNYAFQKIVAFDLARESQFMPYQLIENFKNGVIFSPKYESRMKYSNNVKVVVFSNELPDRSKLSHDRWNIKQI